MESTLSTPCSRSDLPLSLAKVWLSPILTLSPLMIWYSGQAALPYLPTALSVALRPLFHFRQAQYAPVFSLRPVPFCTLFAGLGSTNKSAISLLFCYLTLVLSSPPCPFLHLFFYLKLCGRSGRNCLLSLPVLSGYNGSPSTCFSWVNDTADDLARRGALLVPSAIPRHLSPHISRIHSCLLSDWRRTVLSKFLTHRFPQSPPRNLCSVVMFAVFSLVFTATETAFF